MRRRWRSTLVLAAVERLAKAADNYDRALGAAAAARRGARSREAGRAEPAALHLGARLQVRRGPAEARVVQAPRLRAGVLYRLRRQDAARHPRRDRTEGLGRAEEVHPDRRHGHRQARGAGRQAASLLAPRYVIRIRGIAPSVLTSSPRSPPERTDAPASPLRWPTDMRTFRVPHLARQHARFDFAAKSTDCPQHTGFVDPRRSAPVACTITYDQRRRTRLFASGAACTATSFR